MNFQKFIRPTTVVGIAVLVSTGLVVYFTLNRLRDLSKGNVTNNPGIDPDAGSPMFGPVGAVAFGLDKLIGGALNKVGTGIANTLNTRQRESLTPGSSPRTAVVVPPANTRPQLTADQYMAAPFEVLDVTVPPFYQ